MERKKEEVAAVQKTKEAEIYSQLLLWVYPKGYIPLKKKVSLMVRRKFLVFSSTAYYHGFSPNYVKDEEIWIPGEYCISSFSIKKGLNMVHHNFVDPGFEPGQGYSGEIYEQVAELRIPSPTPHEMDAEKATQLTRDVLQPIIKMIRAAYEGFGDEVQLMPVVILVPPIGPNQLAMAEDFFKFIAFNTGFKLPEIKIISMAHAIRFFLCERFTIPRDDQGEITEKMAETVLLDTTLEYLPDIACPHHQKEQNQGSVIFCPKNIVIRSIYYALDRLCNVFQVNKEKKSHQHEGDFELKKQEIDAFIQKNKDEDQLAKEDSE